MTSIPEWLRTDHPREVIEAALAHVVRNRVEAAYTPLRPVRAPADVDGRVGALPGPRNRGGFGALIVKRSVDPAGGVEKPRVPGSVRCKLK